MPQKTHRTSYPSSISLVHTVPTLVGLSMVLSTTIYAKPRGLIADNRSNLATQAQRSESTPKPPSFSQIRKENTQGSHGVSLQIMGGVASFQDIQPPVASSGDFRIDGTTTAEDSSNHSGLAIKASIGYQPQSKLGHGVFELGIYRASSNAPLGSLASSYQRYSFVSGFNWKLSSRVSASTLGEIRRSAFRNTDNSHYLDSGILKIGATYAVEDFDARGLFGYAPYSQLGYSSNSASTKSGLLKDTTTSLIEWTLDVGYKPSPSSRLFFEYSEERVTANISRLSTYNDLGFAVGDEYVTSQSKTFNLSTKSFMIGATRIF